jgi:glucose uptake protein GlcU
MLSGYFLFESFMYGLTAAKGAIVMNLIQAGAGVAMAFLLSQAHSLAEEKKKK